MSAAPPSGTCVKRLRCQQVPTGARMLQVGGTRGARPPLYVLSPPPINATSSTLGARSVAQQGPLSEVAGTKSRAGQPAPSRSEGRVECAGAASFTLVNMRLPHLTPARGSCAPRLLCNCLQEAAQNRGLLLSAPALLPVFFLSIGFSQ